MYTDGDSVYEASYRYRDGRNGMHKVSTLKQFLSSAAVNSKDKDQILKKLKEASPDVVLEL
jgi:23S rRNA maturation mini-RNase III